ncbi:hypothetical protein [Anaerosolibacter sp.]|uniref:hypothetical protein n=1 Tax=Anaerosolibacter sp. TaxID=1872527 RepID=UPI0039F09439
MNEILKKGKELLSWVLLYYVFSFIFQALFWFESLSFLRIFVLPLTLGYILLWFYFGYTRHMGFWKGILIGLIGAVPATFFTFIQALILTSGRDITGTFFDVVNLSTIPLLWFYTAFQRWKLSLYYMPYLLTPLLVLLCGLGSHLGLRKKT